jgi:hypothetical protein
MVERDENKIKCTQNVDLAHGKWWFGRKNG